MDDFSRYSHPFSPFTFLSHLRLCTGVCNTTDGYPNSVLFCYILFSQVHIKCAHCSLFTITSMCYFQFAKLYLCPFYGRFHADICVYIYGVDLDRFKHNSDGWVLAARSACHHVSAIQFLYVQHAFELCCHHCILMGSLQHIPFILLSLSPSYDTFIPYIKYKSIDMFP